MAEQWRTNLYGANCCICGTRIEAEQGHYRNDLVDGRKFYCATDKARYDLDPNIQPQPGFTRNAAGDTTPTQASVVDIDVDVLAQRTADLTFKQVADHFTSTVMPSVEANLPTLVKTELNKMVRIAEIKVGKLPTVKVGTAHKMLPTIVEAVMADVNPYLVGPAGSGKTTLAKQVAEVLKLKFYSASRVTSEFKLLGYMDANGKYVRTAFRDAFEYGGLFLWDELDASDSDAMTSFNTALENKFCDFPDGMVQCHKDFRAIAAGNTFGRGADRQYVGRTQLDAATLDRFVDYEVEYDEDLENEVAGNLEWSTYVQKVRRVVETQQVRHIVSPRASIKGARLLAVGQARETVAYACIWKGLDVNVRRRIEDALAYA